MFNLTNDSIYYDNAEDAALWLESETDSSASGYRWATFGGYYTGFSTGTSGVGLFFLKMHGVEVATSMSETNSTSGFVLLQNIPNPFTQRTVIRIQGLEVCEKAEIKIYNIEGIVVCSIPIPDSQFPIIEVMWDGKNDIGEEVSSGTYLVRLIVGNKYVQSTKLLFLK